MSNILVSSEDNKKHKIFQSQEEFISALCNNEIEFTPVIKNKQFSDVVFEKSGGDKESEEYWDALPTINAKFENCEFKNVKFIAYMNITLSNCIVNGMDCIGKNNSINTKDCTLNELSMEYQEDANIKSENTKFKKLSISESDIIFDAKNCNFDENNIFKTQVGGNIEGGTFSVAGRIYLGQYQDLTMKNVDFGSEKIDETYFFEGAHHDNLELINCKNAGEILNKKKEGELIISSQDTQQSYKGIER